MKSKILIFLLSNLPLIMMAKTFHPGKIESDSTKSQKYIANLLEEYDLGGRWIYLRIDSCDNNFSFKIVESSSLHELFKSKFITMDKDFFVKLVTQLIVDHKGFENCGHENNPIKGRNVNMEVFDKLSNIKIQRLIHKYFDKRHFLKKGGRKILAEIIAVCYNYQIKVITPIISRPYYTIF